MIRLLVFEVLLFGLFNVVLGQFIGQSREAYAIWIQEIVYSGSSKNPDDDRKICSNLESLSREICGLTDLLAIVVGLIILTFIVTFAVISWNYNLITEISERNITLASGFLAFSVVLSLPYIMWKLNIYIYDPSKSSQIDEKIFAVWYKRKCHNYKNEQYRNKLQPIQLYEILAEKIDAGEIKPSQEELNLVTTLLRKKNVGLP
jgi:hypothetical protein